MVMQRLGANMLCALSIGVAAYAIVAYTALTFAAVTLRLYLPSSMAAGIPFEIAYPAIAWLCWLPNVAVAEWLVRRPGATTNLRASGAV